MARVLYSIPLIGLALSGCQDPISAAFVVSQVSFAGDIPLPFNQLGIDIGGGVTCDAVGVSTSLRIGNDLAGDFIYTYTYECSDGRGVSYTYDTYVFVEVLEKGARYRLSLLARVDGGDFLLDCVMDAKESLSCVDETDGSWSFNQ